LKDRSHGEIGFEAESSKNTADTVHAINMFAGQRKIKAAYSDGSEEIQAACKQLCIPHTTSTPGRPRSNGVAERTVRQVITGVRVALHSAGLPDPFWQYAARHWCHGYNITPGEKPGQRSAYFYKWGHDFAGQLIPFGALIRYKVGPLKQRLWSKLQAQSVPGIFLGYKLHPGGEWRGEYTVQSLRAYNNTV